MEIRKEKEENIYEIIEDYNEENKEDEYFMTVASLTEVTKELVRKSIEDEQLRRIKYLGKLLDNLYYYDYNDYIKISNSYVEWNDLRYEFGDEMKPEIYNKEEVLAHIRS